jgi:GTP-binding protein HflX
MPELQNHETAPARALLCAVQLPDTDDTDLADSLAELARLAKTLGLVVDGTVTQRRDKLDPAAYLGPGKVKDVKALVEEKGLSYLLVDHEISPSQARNLEKETGAEVLDRTAVILEIFHRHARSKAARAQVELARLQYMAPRLREQGKLRGAERQQGGIGGKGAGESQLELDRRKIRDRIAELTEQLEQLDVERQTRRERRSELFRAALIGYTNAGKSTLMRALTGSEVLVADKLFATLDTTVRVLQPETRPRILISDTVGFIKKLPHRLVASFHSTLEEALEASLLVHMVDASDPAWERQLEVTYQVLDQIGASDVPRLLCFNKLDKVGDEAAQTEMARVLAERFPEAIVVSAKRPDDVGRVRQALIDHFGREMIEDRIFLDYTRQALRGEIFESCQVLDESYDESGVVLHVRARPEVLERLRPRLTARAS